MKTLISFMCKWSVGLRKDMQIDNGKYKVHEIKTSFCMLVAIHHVELECVLLTIAHVHINNI